MLLTFALVLGILWLLTQFGLHLSGGLLVVVLVVAVVALVIELLRWRYKVPL